MTRRDDDDDEMTRRRDDDDGETTRRRDDDGESAEDHAGKRGAHSETTTTTARAQSAEENAGKRGAHSETTTTTARAESAEENAGKRGARTMRRFETSAEASRTRVDARPGFLATAEIAAVHDLAARAAPEATRSRSHDDTRVVTYARRADISFTNPTWIF